MVGLGVGYMAKLVAAFVEGDDNLLDHVLQKKLESLGEEFLMKFIGGPIGTADRFAAMIDSGGTSELAHLGNAWLKGGAPMPMPPGFMGNMQHALRVMGGHPAARTGKWAHSQWASSRNDWLDNHWRHDWRSQPRDVHGRWIPGRLGYIAMTLERSNLKYRGTHKGRVVRHKQKLKRMARARGRRMAKNLVREMKKNAR